MTHPELQPAFPFFRASASLLAGGLVAGAAGTYIAGGAAPLAAACVTVLAIIGLLPVAVLGPRGVIPTVSGYFAGMFVRFIGTLVWFGWLAMHDVPAATDVLIPLTVAYLLLLAIEVTWVSRYLLDKDKLRCKSGDGDGERDNSQRTGLDTDAEVANAYASAGAADRSSRRDDTSPSPFTEVAPC